MNEHQNPDDHQTSRRYTAMGVVGGLIAGGALGLAVTVPSLTSAASDDSTTETDATVPALQDDTDEAPESTESTDERREPGERLREALQPLVDDGTIDAAQADAVTEHLIENRPERPERGHGRWRRGLDGHGRHNAVVAELLDMERDELLTELAAGKSIADIATENGIDVQTVIDGLIADAESHIDLAVDHGLDEERAAELLERVTERIEEGVNRTRPTDG